MIDPFDQPPVYEQNQVLTEHDLVAVRSGFIWQYWHTKWYHPLVRYKWKAAIGTMDSLINYLQKGKQK